LSFYFFGFGFLVLFLMYSFVFTVTLILPRTLASRIGILFFGGFQAYMWFVDVRSGLNLVRETFLCLMMINFQKVMMTLLSYSDAGLLDTEAEKSLTPFERKHAQHLRQFPSYFDWLNYMVFVGSAVSYGPSTEYSRFDDFINLRRDFGMMQQYSNFLPAFKRLLHMIIVMVVFSTIETFCHITKSTEPDLYERSFPIRFAIMIGGVHACILKLCVGFLGMECNSIASGLGYRAATKLGGSENSKEQEPEDFNTLRTIEMMKYYNSKSPRDLIVCWN